MVKQKNLKQSCGRSLFGALLGAVLALSISSCGNHETWSFVDGQANAQKVETDLEGKIIVAISADDAAALEELFNGGLDVNHRLGDGQTLLGRAVALGKRAIVQLLVASGADRAIPDKTGATPCDAAGNASDLRAALGCPADQAIVREAFSAARTGEVRKLQALLKDGLDVNIRDPDGETLLTAAIRASQSKIVEMMVRGFLKSGLDLNLPGADGKTPLEIAREMALTAVERVLIANGAKE